MSRMRIPENVISANVIAPEFQVHGQHAPSSQPAKQLPQYPHPSMLMHLSLTSRTEQYGVQVVVSTIGSVAGAVVRVAVLVIASSGRGIEVGVWLGNDDSVVAEPLIRLTSSIAAKNMAVRIIAACCI